MAQIGKRLKAAQEAVDRAKPYPLPEAIKLLKQNAKAKFDETIEMSMNLGIDPRHADQMVRGLLSLPNGTGKSVRVACSPADPRPRRLRPRAPTWSAPRTWPRRCRAATSISTVASPPRT